VFVSWVDGTRSEECSPVSHRTTYFPPGVHSHSQCSTRLPREGNSVYASTVNRDRSQRSVLRPRFRRSLSPTKHTMRRRKKNRLLESARLTNNQPDLRLLHRPRQRDVCAQNSPNRCTSCRHIYSSSVLYRLVGTTIQNRVRPTHSLQSSIKLSEVVKESYSGLPSKNRASPTRTTFQSTSVSSVFLVITATTPCRKKE
jgi:hypothetical protein